MIRIATLCAIILIAACTDRKSHVNNSVDSTRQMIEKHATLVRSMDEANGLLDRMLAKHRSNRYGSKGCSINDRLHDLQLHLDEQNARMADMEQKIIHYRNQAQAYEMMSVALKDELHFRDEILMDLSDSTERNEEAYLQPMASKPSKVYINFPEN